MTLRPSNRRRDLKRRTRRVGKTLRSLTVLQLLLAAVHRRRSLLVALRGSPLIAAGAVAAGVVLRRRRRRAQEAGGLDFEAPNESAPGPAPASSEGAQREETPAPVTPSGGAPELDLGPPNESAPGHAPGTNGGTAEGAESGNGGEPAASDPPLDRPEAPAQAPRAPKR